MKRITAMLMTAVLTVGALTGCSPGAKDADSAASGKGRYVEKDMELPLGEDEIAVNFTRSGEGNPLLFASDAEQVFRYEYKEDSWEKAELSWTKELMADGVASIVGVEETGDGTQYVLTMDNETLMSTLTRREAGAAEGTPGEQVDIPYMQEETEFGYPYVNGMFVDEAGHIWLSDILQVTVVDGETRETLMELPAPQSFSTTQKLFFSGENGQVAVCTEEGKYTIYNAGTLEETGTLSTDSSTDDGYALCQSGDNWYQISIDGISRMRMGNDIEEIIMDGNSGAMGSPLNSVMGMIPGGDGEFYALYTQADSYTYSLEHYVYDENIAAVPEHTLTVFGLTKSDTIQQAVTQFQKANPDVKVEFHTLGKSAEEVTSDDIRTLNTELLSGNGADVLVLDGMSSDSYIEKGILEDITGLSEDILGSDDYMESVMKNTVQKDGKIYGLPVKFSVPIMFGNEAAMSALGSLDSLIAYLEANPETDIFGDAGSTYIRDVLFMLYQDEIIGEDGKVDRDALSKLLEAAGRIVENVGSDEMGGMYYSGDDITVSSPFDNDSGLGVAGNPEAAATADIGNLWGMMLPYAVMRQAGLTPQSVQNMYHPLGTVGINSGSDQKELAEEFVRFLFGTEVQSASLNDGFPVLISALDAKVEEAANTQAGIAVAVEGEDGASLELDAGYPEEAEVRGFIEMCHTLDKPMEQNRVVWNIYQEEADKYLEGSVDADEAAGNIAQKVDTYLSE